MFEGRYLVKITGRNPKDFLAKLITLKLPLLNIQLEKDDLILFINEETYQKIKEMKTTYKITILNRYGTIKVKYLFHKYFFFILAVFLSLILLKILSLFILKVEVIHTKEEIRQLVIEDLNEYGIAPYHFKVSFAKKEKIVQEILEKEKEKLEWLEIEERGTSYLVNVEERKKNTKEQETEEQSIVAKKTGRILEIEAIHGEIVKKKNDYVQKGEVIISGIIKNKETPVSKVRAEGKVFAETWYQVTVEVPYSYQELEKTGKKKKRLEIDFLNHSYLLLDFNPYQKAKKKKVAMIENRLLPIGLYFTTLEEVRVKEEIHNQEEAYQKALSIAKKKLKQTLSKEDEIISQKTLKKSHKNSKIVVEVFFKVKENITDTVSLKEVKLEDLQKEEEKGE